MTSTVSGAHGRMEDASAPSSEPATSIDLEPRLVRRLARVPGGFPVRRPRRLRAGEGLRRLVRETSLDAGDFIYPLFISEVVREPAPITSMPGQVQWPLGELGQIAERVASLGIGGVLLFGIPVEKDEVGSQAYAHDGVVQRAVRELKAVVPDLLVVTDVCLCEYTSHGHCGVIRDGEVRNDETLDLLAREALSHVEAGADIVAPSDMMDGRVAALRQALDEVGRETVPIMAYSAKFASAFYGPFRDAAESAPRFGDRRGYQMDPANGREALREVELDVAEGADIVMVKPALPYLDVLARVRDRWGLPVAAYNVSGEYAMIKAAAANGWLDERRAVMEALTGIRRAGADVIISYHALDAAQWLMEG